MTARDRESIEKPPPDRPTPVRLVAQGALGRPAWPIVCGLIGTVVLHLALIMLAPETFPRTVSEVERRPLERLQVLLVEPDEPEPPEEFVFTNPEAPSNPPDDTTRFSDRAQQAAQEELAREGDPSQPQVTGEEPEATQNIVESETILPSEEMWDLPPGDQEESAPSELLPQQAVPGFEEVEVVEGEGPDVPVVEEGEPVDELVLGVGVERRDSEEARQSGAGGERQVTPRPRPTLPQYSRGPVGARAGAAPRVGTVAVDANFSEFGDYLARMLDAIVRQWHLLAWDALQAGEVGTVVTVTFRIDSTGEVRTLDVDHSTASLIATLICQDAILSRQPYGAWTPDMKEVLGEEQTIRIRFLYR